jgi:hypothetical protein
MSKSLRTYYQRRIITVTEQYRFLKFDFHLPLVPFGSMASLRLFACLWVFQSLLLGRLALAQLDQDYNVRQVIDPITNNYVTAWF